MRIMQNPMTVFDVRFFAKSVSFAKIMTTGLAFAAGLFALALATPSSAASADRISGATEPANVAGITDLSARRYYRRYYGHRYYRPYRYYRPSYYPRRYYRPYYRSYYRPYYGYRPYYRPYYYSYPSYFAPFPFFPF